MAKQDVPAASRETVAPAWWASRFADVWGPVDERPAEDRAYATYRGLLTEAALARADLANGRAVFRRTCGSCHKLYDEGGTIGPDLTGSNRSNLEYLLSNVLNPSGDVQDAYRLVIVGTRDGRTHSGTVVSETDRQLTLRVVGRDPIVIPKSEIQQREATTMSMMPPGLFDALAEQEVVDLVGYPLYSHAISCRTRMTSPARRSSSRRHVAPMASASIRGRPVARWRSSVSMINPAPRSARAAASASVHPSSPRLGTFAWPSVMTTIIAWSVT